MAARALPANAEESRAQRIEAIMKERRPKVEATVRQMAARAADVPEAEEFGTPTTRKPVRRGSNRRRPFSMNKEVKPCAPSWT